MNRPLPGSTLALWGLILLSGSWPGDLCTGTVSSLVAGKRLPPCAFRSLLSPWFLPCPLWASWELLLRLTHPLLLAVFLQRGFVFGHFHLQPHGSGDRLTIYFFQTSCIRPRHLESMRVFQ